MTDPVKFLRDTAPYINTHRGKTFVLAFSGEAVEIRSRYAGGWVVASKVAIAEIVGRDDKNVRRTSRCVPVWGSSGGLAKTRQGDQCDENLKRFV